MRREVGATIRVADGPVVGLLADEADVDASARLRNVLSRRSCFRFDVDVLDASGGSGSLAVCINALSIMVLPIPTKDPAVSLQAHLYDARDLLSRKPGVAGEYNLAALNETGYVTISRVSRQ